MKIDNQGTVVLFTPETPIEHQWLKDNTQHEPYQWRGKSLMVDHRPARDIIDAIAEEGFLK